MPTAYDSSAVVCPYYKDNNKFHIKCESILYGGTSTQNNFISGADREAHMELFCCDLNGYKECEIKKRLDIKYR